ncbi:MAG: transporter substrate-binding domain-containing protein, partial [Sphaerospermopsis sp. SIO1G2]|nr:transporter substrate-binding domain-containing protein [Sphaerospermopsis sp. SIO1G2]
TIRVATKPLAPFVIYDVEEREYTGFSIELWKLIAAEGDLDYELYGVNTLAKLLDEVDRGAADVGTAGIGITVLREHSLDFSYSYLESGLQIMVVDDSNGLWGDGLLTMLRAIFSRQLLEVLALLFLLLLFAAHIMWLSERHVNQDFSVSYWPGIWDAFWWSAVTATTVGYGDHVPRTFIGRLVGIFWMFSGLFVLASFTASMTTAFAINEINAQISGPDDLFGRRVATIERSAAADYLIREGIPPVLYELEDEAYEALISGDVDAIVYDAPVLQHYTAQDLDGTVELVDEIFQAQQYGIAVANNPELREQINLALLKVIESGQYDTLHNIWFGDE